MVAKGIGKSMTVAMAKAVTANSGGQRIEGTFEYRRPGGTDEYRRPNGTDTYKRPASIG